MKDSTSNTAYLLLGSNLDDRESMITKARLMINCFIGHIIGMSSVYETEPWGFESDSHFLNQVLVVETDMDPPELIKAVKDIELNLGRKKGKAGSFDSGLYDSRLIDIDILLFNDLVMEEEDLTIPHPRIKDRLFTLMPLQEVAGNLTHPAYHKSISELKEACTDRLAVKLYPMY